MSNNRCLHTPKITLIAVNEVQFEGNSDIGRIIKTMIKEREAAAAAAASGSEAQQLHHR